VIVEYIDAHKHGVEPICRHLHSATISPMLGAGQRPGATRLSFPVADRVSARVSRWWTLTQHGDGSVQTFNAGGQLVSIKDRNSNTTTVTYTTGGAPNQIVSPAGPSAPRTATFSAPASDTTLLTQSNGTTSRSVTYTRDTYGDLIEISDTMGRPVTLSHSGQYLNAR
jgi:YD repeat-containing protein